MALITSWRQCVRAVCDEDGSRCNPHSHFALEISTDVNMVENTSHGMRTLPRYGTRRGKRAWKTDCNNCALLSNQILVLNSGKQFWHHTHDLYHFPAKARSTAEPGLLTSPSTARCATCLLKKCAAIWLSISTLIYHLSRQRGGKAGMLK